ncbi:pheromone-regulated protein PRM7-like [Miscanthus floridulus]|uniref:pheromone-regulated protein PRM7-like n=1 Tax=Miscanthus floridulus TaxID=154761 RepID=UPI0034592A25
MPEDPSATSSSIRPAPSTTAWTAGGVDCTTPSNATMAASDPTGLVAVTATSVWSSSGANCAAPSDATTATPDSAQPTSGPVTWAAGGTECATPSNATAAASSCYRLGAVAATCSATTTGAAGLANEATTSVPLLPEIGAMSDSTIRPA